MTRILDTEIELQTPFVFNLGKVQKLLWPCYVYSFSFPISKKSKELNILEKLILRVLDSFHYDSAKSIAEDVCMNVDLIKTIVTRLKERGFIDKYNNIIDEKRKFIYDEKSEKEYVTGYVFREYYTGLFFPYIKIPQNIGEGLKERDELKQKGEKCIYYKHSNDLKDKYNEEKNFTNKDLRNDIRIIAKKIFQRNGYDNKIKNIEKNDIQISTVTPELWLIPCEFAVVQLMDDKNFWHISNPFFEGYSNILESALEKISSTKEFNKIFEHLISSSQISISETEDENDEFDNKKNGPYCQIRDIVESIQKKKEHSVKDLYSALEWILYYFCIEKQEKLEKVLISLEEGNHNNILTKAAENIGFNLKIDEQQKITFIDVPPGKIQDFKEGNPYMQTVLSIALLIAENDEEMKQRMEALKNINKNFIKDVFKLKNFAGDFTHGSFDKTNYRDYVSSKFENLDNFIKEVADKLLKKKISSDEYRNMSDIEKVENRRIEAYKNIFSIFSNFYSIDLNLRDMLVDFEAIYLKIVDKQENKNDTDFVKFINLAYMIYQNTIETLNIKHFSQNNMDIWETIETKVKNCGFKSDNFAYLKETKKEEIKNAINHRKTTLGGCILAFLYFTGQEDLNSIAKMDSYLLEDIVNIIKKRGHGNKKTEDLKEYDIEKIRKQIYKIIPILGGL